MLHSKNSIAPSPAQASGDEHPDTTASVEPKLPTFSPEQAAFVADLLAAERRHASRWWTFLSEIRRSGELPEWVKAKVVGRHSDFDEWDESCLRTNRELLGITGHIGAIDESQLIDCSVGVWIDSGVIPAPQTDPAPFRGAPQEVGHDS